MEQSAEGRTAPAVKHLENELLALLCKEVSPEFDVEHIDIIPFVTILNLIKEELRERAPEIYLSVISFLHQYDPAADTAHEQYNKLLANLRIMLNSCPMLCEALITLIPDPLPTRTVLQQLHRLPAVPQGFFFNRHGAPAHHQQQQQQQQQPVLYVSSETGTGKTRIFRTIAPSWPATSQMHGVVPSTQPLLVVRPNAGTSTTTSTISQVVTTPPRLAPVMLANPKATSVKKPELLSNAQQFSKTRGAAMDK